MVFLTVTRMSFGSIAKCSALTTVKSPSLSTEREAFSGMRSGAVVRSLMHADSSAVAARNATDEALVLIDAFLLVIVEWVGPPKRIPPRLSERVARGHDFATTRSRVERGTICRANYLHG